MEENHASFVKNESSVVNKLTSLLIAGSVLLLSACDGGNGQIGQPDTSAPILSSVTTTPSATGELTMTVAGTDNVGITGYCFSPKSTAPLASDACFQDSNQKKIQITAPIAPIKIWAKDAAGNVTTTALTGPCSSAGYLASDASTLPTVCMLTTLGELVLALENVKAPVTTANFLNYVKSGFYSDTVFHRILSSFVVQGGGLTYSAGTKQYAPKNPIYPAIDLEAPASTGLSNTLGTVAMARTDAANSATSQFFINTVNNIFLDTSGGGYAVFGRVISGVSTLDALKATPVVLSPSGELSLPTSPPVIQWAVQLK